MENHANVDAEATAPMVNIMSVRFEKLAPAKRRKKEVFQDASNAYDLTRIKFSEVEHLPGGLMRAVDEAYRRRNQPLTGVCAILGGRQTRPGDWILIGDTWLLILELRLDNAILVDRGGGYQRCDARGLRERVRVSTEFPPWWESWLEGVITSRLEMAQAA